MPTPRVFCLLQVGSGTPQGLVKVHGFLFARTINVQGDKGLGVTLVVLVCYSKAS